MYTVHVHVHTCVICVFVFLSERSLVIIFCYLTFFPAFNLFEPYTLICTMIVNLYSKDQTVDD